MLRNYVDRGVLRVACWAVTRLRARGPLPAPLLEAAGLLRVVDGDPYLQRAPGTWTTPRGVAAAPPPRVDMWRRSPFWSRDPAPPPPSPWFRQP